MTYYDEIRERSKILNKLKEEATKPVSIDDFIEKACEWLKENKDKYLYNDGEKGEYIPTCSTKMIEDFKKHMKGEEL